MRVIVKAAALFVCACSPETTVPISSGPAYLVWNQQGDRFQSHLLVERHGELVSEVSAEGIWLTDGQTLTRYTVEQGMLRQAQALMTGPEAATNLAALRCMAGSECSRERHRACDRACESDDADCFTECLAEEGDSTTDDMSATENEDSDDEDSDDEDALEDEPENDETENANVPEDPEDYVEDAENGSGDQGIEFCGDTRTVYEETVQVFGSIGNQLFAEVLFAAMCERASGGQWEPSFGCEQYCIIMDRGIVEQRHRSIGIPSIADFVDDDELLRTNADHIRPDAFEAQAECFNDFVTTESFHPVGARPRWTVAGLEMHYALTSGDSGSEFSDFCDDLGLEVPGPVPAQYQFPFTELLGRYLSSNRVNGVARVPEEMIQRVAELMRSPG